MESQAIPTGVCEPLLKGTVGLLLDHSNLNLKGLQEFPGVIDADYTREIRLGIKLFKTLFKLLQSLVLLNWPLFL